MYVHHIHAGAQKAQKHGSPGAGVAEGCDLHDVGVVTSMMWVLCAELWLSATAVPTFNSGGITPVLM